MKGSTAIAFILPILLLMLFPWACQIQPYVLERWVVRYSGPDNHDDEACAIAVDGLGNVYVTGYSVGNVSGDDYATIKYNKSGVEQWVAKYNGPGNGGDRANAIALDGSGNVYVTGSSYGSDTGKDYATIKYNGAGVEEWVARYNGPGDGNDEASAMAVDGSGNVYVTGSSLGKSTGVNCATIKYDTKGNQLWEARYKGPVGHDDEARAIAVDGLGNVYITGYTGGAGPTANYITIRYDTTGNQLWAQQYNGPDKQEDWARGIAVNNSGDVYVTGHSWGSDTNYDYTTVKYDADGNQLWVSRYNGPGNGFDEVNAIAVDGSGNVYITGVSPGSASNDDYATVKYNSDGVEQWVARYDGPGQGRDWANDLAVDSSGNVYVTGYSKGVDTGNDYATVKYDVNGNQIWVGRYNGPGRGIDETFTTVVERQGPDYASAIVVDGSGNIYVTGYSGGLHTGMDYATIKYSQVNIILIIILALSIMILATVLWLIIAFSRRHFRKQVYKEN
jgi:uncharacterized delta-60 repeat protein